MRVWDERDVGTNQDLQNPAAAAFQGSGGRKRECQLGLLRPAWDDHDATRMCVYLDNAHRDAIVDGSCACNK